MGDPTFLIIGAPKCGTSWLWGMLARHPEVAVSGEKEVHFFDRSARFARGVDWYRAQFPFGPGTKAAGEATPFYFAGGMDRESCLGEEGRSCARLVHEQYPDIRLVLLLRDPVERAVSNYYQRIKAGTISPGTPFLSREHTRGIVETGYYDVHLRRWWDLFPRGNLLVLFYEEAVAANRTETLSSVFRFLGVDPEFVPEGLDRRYNPTPSHFSIRLEHGGRRLARKAEERGRDRWAVRIDAASRRVRHEVEKRMPRKILRSRRWEIPVGEEEREMLRMEYRESNRRLAEMLGRELPW